jgi:hypothetical protein
MRSGESLQRREHPRVCVGVVAQSIPLYLIEVRLIAMSSRLGSLSPVIQFGRSAHRVEDQIDWKEGILSAYQFPAFRSEDLELTISKIVLVELLCGVNSLCRLRAPQVKHNQFIENIEAKPLGIEIEGELELDVFQWRVKY